MAGGRKRRSWTAVGAALILAWVGAGVGGWLAPSTSWLARAVGAAVGAVAGLVAAIWVDRGSQRREARKAALRAREDVLDALVADPASEGSIFDVLLATSTKAAPFRGRRDDVAGLDRVVGRSEAAAGCCGDRPGGDRQDQAGDPVCPRQARAVGERVAQRWPRR